MTTINEDIQRAGCWRSGSEVLTLLGLNKGPATEDWAFQHVRVSKGRAIYTVGQAVDNLYLVNTGFLKTAFIDEFGNSQVMGFPMRGDMLGLDGLHDGNLHSEIIALTDCDLIVLPYKEWTTMCRQSSDLFDVMQRLLSRELARKQTMLVAMGLLSADARVARFIVDLGRRFGEMGYSSKLFNLRMTRQDMASHLGITLETASRIVSELARLKLITVDQRTIGILDLEKLKTLRRITHKPRMSRSSAETKKGPLNVEHQA